MDAILARMANLRSLLVQQGPGRTISRDLTKEAWRIFRDFEQLFGFWSEVARENKVPWQTIQSLRSAMDHFRQLLIRKSHGSPNLADRLRQEQIRVH